MFAWSFISGGKCTDAWPMLTGSRNQFVIMRNAKTQKYGCYAKFNPLKGKWTDHRNSPHDYDQSCWRVGWPKVGGGGSENLDLTQEELFARLVAWNDTNYLIGAGTDGVSDKASTDGKPQPFPMGCFMSSGPPPRSQWLDSAKYSSGPEPDNYFPPRNRCAGAG